MQNETIQTRNLTFESAHKWQDVSKTALIPHFVCAHCGTRSYRVAFGFMYYNPHEHTNSKTEPQCVRLNSKTIKSKKS